MVYIWVYVHHNAGRGVGKKGLRVEKRGERWRKTNKKIFTHFFPWIEIISVLAMKKGVCSIRNWKIWVDNRIYIRDEKQLGEYCNEFNIGEIDQEQKHFEKSQVWKSCVFFFFFFWFFFFLKIFLNFSFFFLIWLFFPVFLYKWY